MLASSRRQFLGFFSAFAALFAVGLPKSKAIPAEDLETPPYPVVKFRLIERTQPYPNRAYNIYEIVNAEELLKDVAFSFSSPVVGMGTRAVSVWVREEDTRLVPFGIGDGIVRHHEWGHMQLRQEVLDQGITRLEFLTTGETKIVHNVFGADAAFNAKSVELARQQRNAS